MDNQEFIEARQSQWNTQPEVIYQQVARVTGGDVKGMDRITKGGWNEVYKVETSKDPVIVRISNLGHQFKVEQWARERAAQAGVPVVRTLDVSSITDEDKEKTIEISEFVDGQEMKDLEELPEEERRSLTQQAGAILSKIHSIKLNRFGVVGEETTELGAETLSEYKAGIIKNRSAQWAEGLRVSRLDDDQISTIIEKLGELYSKYDEDVPTLAHMDFLPKHLMIKDGQIVAVLDFGNARSTTPIEDFANWNEGFFKLEWLLKGYENQSLVKDPSFKTRLELARLFLNLEQIPFAFKNNLQWKLEPISQRIKKNLEILQIPI